MSGLLPSEILAKAADLIDPEGAWAQGSRRHGALCAVDALASATPQGALWLDVIHFAYRAIGSANDGLAISEWNDVAGRTQSEVVAAFRKASELARSEGQ